MLMALVDDVNEKSLTAECRPRCALRAPYVVMVLVLIMLQVY